MVTEIGQQELSLGPKGAKKYKLDLLKRVAKRVDDFSTTCAECEAHKKDISRLVDELNMAIQAPGQRVPKEFNRTLNNIVEHLKKVHKLVDKGHYMGIGIGIGLALGAGIGAAIGAATDNPGIGTGVGIALGLAIGAYLDKRAKDEGRVI